MNNNQFIESELVRLEITKLVEKYASIVYQPTQFIPGKSNIPPSGKLINQEELKYMVNASLDGWLTAGRFNKEFEKKLANYLGVKNLITVNSGSSANLVAFNTLTSVKLGNKAIKKGDEIITVAAGFPTTVNPILQFGAVPVFIDIELETYNIDVSKVEKAINLKTKAIVLAHTLGNPFNLDEITRLCKKYNLWLIEDCCDALGSKYREKFVGTFGDISTLSFYPAHHITMGEGGAVFTDNDELIKIAESFRDWGRDCYCEPGKDNTCNKRFCHKLGQLPFGYDHKYTYSHLGYNLKITDMQAACGVAQLNKIEDFHSKRRINFDYLLNSLQICSEFLLLPKATSNSVPSWFGFPITLKHNAPVNRVDLISYLDQHNIGTRLLFAGNLTKQPSLENTIYKIDDNLINTDIVMENTFWIGIQPSLNIDMLEYSSSKIRSFLGFDFK
jgi:CDP-6-deoxy-D-xylo-4-hexulose-3-dehydrase